MDERAHVAVVDDDAAVRETIAEYLALHGYRVSAVGGGAGLRALLARDRPEIVLLDLNMPGEDGLSLARHLKGETSVGVIMLTAAGEVVDRVVGLEVGADDYVTKPFDLRELLARIKALQRRLGGRRDVVAAGGEARALALGRFRLDLDGHALRDGAGAEVPLTSMEFDLLKAFAENPNKVLSRERLLELAHHRHWDPFDRSIDVRITRLRRKIEADPSKPQIIKTVRGAGYVFVPQPDERRG